MGKLSALTVILLCLALALSGCVLRGPVSQSAGEISLPERVSVQCTSPPRGVYLMALSMMLYTTC